MITRESSYRTKIRSFTENSIVGMQLLRTASGTYVILFHVARLDFSYNAVGVATAAAAAGPYQYVKSFLPNGMPSFDMNIYEDVDGRTYLARSLGTQPVVMVSELTSDFMNVGDTCTSLSGSKVRGASDNSATYLVLVTPLMTTM